METINIKTKALRDSYSKGDKSVKKALEELVSKSVLTGTPIGIWCMTTDGELVKPEDWRPEYESQGVAFIHEKIEIIIGTHASASLQWGAMDQAKHPLVTDKESLDSKAATDAMLKAYEGTHYKDKDAPIWNVKGSPVAEFVRQYSLGEIAVGLWDVPTFAMVELIQENVDAINECMEAMGVWKITPGYMYSSIAYEDGDTRGAWAVGMSNGGVDWNYRDNDCNVRAVTAFSNFKKINL